MMYLTFQRRFSCISEIQKTIAEENLKRLETGTSFFFVRLVTGLSMFSKFDIEAHF